MTQPPFPVRRFLAPRYWPVWAGLGATWCLARLPYAWLMRLGRFLGRAMLALPGRRRHIAAVNLSLCFPELTAPRRRELLVKHFESLGMSMLEMALCWWAPPARLYPLAQVEGLEHLERALAQGRGAILLIAHFTTMEMAGTQLALRMALCASYRVHNNALFEEVMRRARLAHGAVIAHDDIRAMLRTLKDNKPLWYAPDQNYAGKRSVFAPFFGVPASTMTATAELARLSGAPLIPLFPQRLPQDQGYRIVLQPPLEHFPSGDAYRDTVRINALIEEQVRRIPEQYLWVHRRFKTRPPGSKDFYGV